MRSDPELCIRPATEADIQRIESIAVAAEMFAAEDAGFLGDQFRAARRGEVDGAHWLVLERGHEVVAAAFYAPEPFSDRMWNLYFIAVEPPHQGEGVGRRLMHHVEDALRACGEQVARTLIVETSSTAKYDRTRAFYRGLGYAEEARIRQFYGPADDKVVFWKSLVESP